jgi:hypothetical protein
MIKCILKMQEKNLLIDNKIITYNIDLLIDLKLNFLIPDKFFTSVWGKIFYLICEFIMIFKY